MKTVLIVEDNEDNRLIYAAMLEHVGYRVLQANNGADGLAVARTEHPDLILMDISMPVMDGHEATRTLKADPDLRTIPVLAVTAHAMTSDQELAFAAGCDGYIAKPVEPQAIRALVERWIGRPVGR